MYGDGSCSHKRGSAPHLPAPLAVGAQLSICALGATRVVSGVLTVLGQCSWQTKVSASTPAASCAWSKQRPRMSEGIIQKAGDTEITQENVTGTYLAIREAQKKKMKVLVTFISLLSSENFSLKNFKKL